MPLKQRPERASGWTAGGRKHNLGSWHASCLPKSLKSNPKRHFPPLKGVSSEHGFLLLCLFDAAGLRWSVHVWIKPHYGLWKLESTQASCKSLAVMREFSVALAVLRLFGVRKMFFQGKHDHGFARSLIATCFSPQSVVFYPQNRRKQIKKLYFAWRKRKQLIRRFCIVTLF